MKGWISSHLHADGGVPPLVASVFSLQRKRGGERAWTRHLCPHRLRGMQGHGGGWCPPGRGGRTPQPWQQTAQLEASHSPQETPGSHPYPPCSLPGGLGLGAAEQRALHQPRQAGDLLLHRLHPLPAMGKGEEPGEELAPASRTPSGLSQPYPHPPTGSLQVPGGTSGRWQHCCHQLYPPPSFPLSSCLQLPPIAPLSPAQFGVSLPILAPLPPWRQGKTFLRSSSTSPAAPTDNYPSSKVHIHRGISPVPLLTSFPYP